MSLADTGPVPAPIPSGSDDIGLEPHLLWELHGSSLLAMARALLGDESTALRAVTWGLVDLYRRPEDAPRDSASGRRAAVSSVYQQCRAMSLEDPLRWSITGSPAMTRLGEVALLQRQTLALCVFGGYSYREAATLLEVPAGRIAELLFAGLQELGRPRWSGVETSIDLPQGGVAG